MTLHLTSSSNSCVALRIFMDVKVSLCKGGCHGVELLLHLLTYIGQKQQVISIAQVVKLYPKHPLDSFPLLHCGHNHNPVRRKRTSNRNPPCLTLVLTSSPDDLDLPFVDFKVSLCRGVCHDYDLLLYLVVCVMQKQQVISCTQCIHWILSSSSLWKSS